LVSDNMKFSRSAPVRIGHLSQIDIFVTDAQPPESIVELCKHNGVQIDVVDAQSENTIEALAS
jgi:DeoR family transcriptional regulator, glycerol-3-phosphate regulon repressor